MTIAFRLESIRNDRFDSGLESDWKDYEAFRVLSSEATRRFGEIPAQWIADHVMSITREADWAVRLDALNAIARRFATARNQRLQIEASPSEDHALGRYRFKSREGSILSVDAVLRSAYPFRGSCDCSDYLRSSLGLCEHLLTALETVAKLTVAETSLRSTGSNRADGPRASDNRGTLVWSPVRDFRGVGDVLGQVRWNAPSSSPPLVQLDAAGYGFARYFETKAGACCLRNTYRNEPYKRSRLVAALLGLARSPARPDSVDPGCVAILERERFRLDRVLKLRRRKRGLTAELESLQRPLFDYQERGVRKFLESGRLLIADEMGLGKTAQAIASAHCLFRRRMIRRGLVIVPAPLKQQWLFEWQHFSPVPVEIVDGSPAQRARIYRSTDSGFLIVNYELLLRDLDSMRDWNPDLVILDEAQRVKNHGTRTAVAVKKLRPDYRLALTGTPLENRLRELASIVEWVDEFALDPKWRLDSWHQLRTDGEVRGRRGVRNLETLRQRIEPLFLRRRRSEVLDQLPSRTDRDLRVHMGKDQWAAHESLSRRIAELLDKVGKRPLLPSEELELMRLMTQQRIISNGMAQRDFESLWADLQPLKPTRRRLRQLESPKLLEFRLLVSQLLDQGRRVIVFSQWRRMLLLAHWSIREVLRSRGWNARFFTGVERPPRRTENVVDFHDDDRVRILFASDAGGTGLNLQRAATCVINMEVPWNPAVYEQRVGRIYRVGQTQPIEVFNLTASAGIEVRIGQLSGNKRALFDELFDGDTDIVEFDDSGRQPSELKNIVNDVSSSAKTSTADPEDSDTLQVATTERSEVVTDLDRLAMRPRPPADTLGARELEAVAGIEIRHFEDGSIRLDADKDSAQLLQQVIESVRELAAR